jgi:hypothetical protein
MYVYKQTEFAGPDGHNLFTVGFYKPDGKWLAESDHATTEAAAARVAYLNGGAQETRPTIEAARADSICAGDKADPLADALAEVAIDRIQTGEWRVVALSTFNGVPGVAAAALREAFGHFEHGALVVVDAAKRAGNA